MVFLAQSPGGLDWGVLSQLGGGGLLAVVIIWVVEGAQQRRGRKNGSSDELKHLKEDVRKMQETLAETKARGDVMWDFVMRRAASEAVQHGIAQMDRVLTISRERAESIIPPGMQHDVQATYAANHWERLSDRDLYFEVERVFGDRLLADVCIPQGLQSGACVWAVLGLLRDQPIRTKVQA